MSRIALSEFLLRAGLLLTCMLLARRFALRHVPAADLPAWVRLREARREPYCARALVVSVAATAVGVVLMALA